MRFRHFRGMWLLAVTALLVSEAATAQRTAPSAPEGLVVTVSEPTSGTSNDIEAELEWDANSRSEMVESYNIYVKSVENWGSDDSEFELYGEAEGTSAVISDLNIGGAAYAYYVTAVNEYGESDPSNVVSTACGRSWNEGDIGTYNGSGASQILTSPPLSGRTDRAYFYDVNTVAEYSQVASGRPEFILQRAPEGMTINEQTGEINWERPVAGMYAVVVQAAIPELHESDQQLWTVDITGNVSSVSGDQDVARSVTAYPNPAGTATTLRFLSSGGERSIVLVDNRGAETFLMSTATVNGENTVRLNLDGQVPGAYMLLVRGGETLLSLPLTVMN